MARTKNTARRTLHPTGSSESTPRKRSKPSSSGKLSSKQRTKAVHGQANKKRKQETVSSKKCKGAAAAATSDVHVYTEEEMSAALDSIPAEQDQPSAKKEKPQPHQ